MNSEKSFDSLLLEGQLASPGLVAGTFFLHPRACFIWERIRSFLDEEFSKLSVQNVLFPSLIPFSRFLEEQKNNNSLDISELLRLHSEKKGVTDWIVLRPTSELLFSYFFTKRLQERSIKPPYLLNQWCQVYRAEKNTKLFFRSREFYWQELHSIHLSKLEALQYLKKIDSIYRKLLKKLLAIQPLSGEKTIIERFTGAEQTLTNECILPDGQTLQLTTTHYLSSFFSALADMKYWVDNSTSIVPVQLSAGCSTRLLGALIEMHKDKTGLVLPWDLSQEQIILLVLPNLERNKVNREVLKIKKELKKFRLKVDYSLNSLGQRMYTYEKLGVPLILILGESELQKQELTLKVRIDSEKYKCSIGRLRREVCIVKKRFNRELLKRSEQYLSNLVVTSQNWRELVGYIEDKKVVLAPWKDDYENECKLKSQKYNFSIRCIKRIKKPSKQIHCVFSGQQADCWAYFGRSY